MKEFNEKFTALVPRKERYIGNPVDMFLLSCYRLEKQTGNSEFKIQFQLLFDGNIEDVIERTYREVSDISVVDLEIAKYLFFLNNRTEDYLEDAKEEWGEVRKTEVEFKIIIEEIEVCG